MNCSFQRDLVPDDRLPALKADYDSGLTLRQVARKHGLSIGTAQRSLHHAGTVMRPATNLNLRVRSSREESNG